ncbi:hypothetical protein TRVL_09536 [Trypanosoma vivax]|nr:hypothetical protein TRVL_09536 [Trypanosoma vivax]
MRFDGPWNAVSCEKRRQWVASDERYETYDQAHSKAENGSGSAVTAWSGRNITGQVIASSTVGAGPLRSSFLMATCQVKKVVGRGRTHKILVSEVTRTKLFNRSLRSQTANGIVKEGA